MGMFRKDWKKDKGKEESWEMQNLKEEIEEDNFKR